MYSKSFLTHFLTRTMFLKVLNAKTAYPQNLLSNGMFILEFKPKW